MMFINRDNAGLYKRLNSVTGAFNLTFKMTYFYQQFGYITRLNLPKPNAYAVYIARVNSGFINRHKGITTLIPIGPYPKSAASQLPAVSSLEAYQTPAH
jgi:hypothetical protein